MFGGTQVDGIHFQEIDNFSQVETFVGNQIRFQNWLRKCRNFSASKMIDEYIRLTNIGFNADCPEPPVFLFDEVQILCIETKDVSTSTIARQAVYHTLFTLLLKNLSFVDLDPICICAGTSDGAILNITENSSVNPMVFSLRPLTEEKEYKTYWEEMTLYRNANS